MRTEEQCKPSERFLFADEYISDKAIAIWKSECVKRCKNKEKSDAYYKYINWKRQANEIAVFTLYAYADFSIPKKFNTIFHLDNPKIYLEVDYELTQSIHEAWFPLNSVDDGHKHLCIFRFEKTVPDIFGTLHKEEEHFSTTPKGQKLLGFCNSNNFEAIAIRIEKAIQLKKTYGDKWWEHDAE
ncbi:hypothetical protein [Terrimonas alba]|uniref:hypothetical protein n=1 Tax=Terrimonas alba TaxID=3349636 RepID=UPI0035F29C05